MPAAGASAIGLLRAQAAGAGHCTALLLGIAQATRATRLRAQIFICTGCRLDGVHPRAAADNKQSPQMQEAMYSSKVQPTEEQPVSSLDAVSRLQLNLIALGYLSDSIAAGLVAPTDAHRSRMTGSCLATDVADHPRDYFYRPLDSCKQPPRHRQCFSATIVVVVLAENSSH